MSSAAAGSMRSSRRACAAAAPLLFLAGILILLRFPPDHSTFYPACPIYRDLHLLCPGCGTARALSALLHGDLGRALHQNALVVCALPLLIGYASVCWHRFARGTSFRWPEVPQLVLMVLLALSVIFGIARNLP